MKEGFGVGRSSWSAVSASLAQYPEGPLAGNDRNQGAGKPWGADRAQDVVGVPSEAPENFPY